MAEQTYTIGKNVYHRHSSGMYFRETCPEKLRDLIARYKGENVRVFYGDVETGKAWAEENDVAGRLTCTMGPCKCPMLVSRGADGGSTLLDSNIVAILCGGSFVYKVPGFTVGDWKIQHFSDVDGYIETVLHDGKIHARFKKAGQAARYVAFMTGKRMAR